MTTILHVDMDAFYAAVEILDHPEYQGKPLIIGGPKDAVRGVVATCSYEARKYGIHSAMAIRKAVSLCPHGIFIAGRMERYQTVSAQIHSIFPEFSPAVEPLSIDEAFLDMTGCEHFYDNLSHMGQCLKQRIKAHTGLTASVGIAPNKFLAKLASDWQKPDGLMIIRTQDIDKLLVPLSVSKIWGVGKKTQQELRKYKIYTIGDLRKFSREWLKARFGSLGNQLYDLARGNDGRIVETHNAVKSISQESTFPLDYTDQQFLKSSLAQMTEKVGYRLRKQKLYAKTISIKVRYTDFTTITRSHTLDYAICDDDAIFRVGWLLFQKLQPAPVRLLGIGASNLSANQQLSLFDNTIETGDLARLMDSINDKFAKTALTRGRTLTTKKDC